MVGDETLTENEDHYLYEFIVRDQQTGVKVYRTGYKVHAYRQDILFTVQQTLRERIATDCLILFNFPVSITEVCSDIPVDA